MTILENILDKNEQAALILLKLLGKKKLTTAKRIEILITIVCVRYIIYERVFLFEILKLSIKLALSTNAFLFFKLIIYELIETLVSILIFCILVIFYTKFKVHRLIHQTKILSKY